MTLSNRLTRLRFSLYATPASPLEQNTISFLSGNSPRGQLLVCGDCQGRGASSRQGRKARIVDISEWRGRENVQRFCRCVGGQRKIRALGPYQWPTSSIEGTHDKAKSAERCGSCLPLPLKRNGVARQIEGSGHRHTERQC